ncbi:MAG TPA: hypothetical protein DIV79_13175 [Opitutae bacterium]|nr:hypothetical protein [Opitutaceae bacterium]HCR30958.1 hypothetical protein [Opitutae bacterium]
MKNQLRILILTMIATGLSAVAWSAESEEEIIQSTIELARSYIGPDEKLDALESIHYKGSLLYSSGDLGTIEMVYQKPMRHRMVAVIGERREVSVLDGSEGWTTFERVVDSVPLSMEIFDPIRILIMQSSVREAFSFFRKPDTRNGDITYEGKEIVNGRECVILTYHHGDGIAYQRFIDAESGQVHRTLDSKGVEYLEEGELIVDGLRFPKKMVSTFSTAIGSQSMEFAYSSIDLNKKLPESDFVMPLP